jgi:hypothetical protein
MSGPVEFAAEAHPVHQMEGGRHRVPSCGRAAGIRRGHNAKQQDRPRVLDSPSSSSLPREAPSQQRLDRRFASVG